VPVSGDPGYRLTLDVRRRKLPVGARHLPVHQSAVPLGDEATAAWDGELLLILPNSEGSGDVLGAGGGQEIEAVMAPLLQRDGLALAGHRVRLPGTRGAEGVRDACCRERLGE